MAVGRKIATCGPFVHSFSSTASPLSRIIRKGTFVLSGGSSRPFQTTRPNPVSLSPLASPHCIVPKVPLALSEEDTAYLEKKARRLVSGDRIALSRAITLVESSAPRHKALSNYLLRCLLEMQQQQRVEEERAGKPSKKPVMRIGVAGTPGVGKSTFIECLGSYLVNELGLYVAVLSIDPSSVRHGGSILGDKTRMPTLAYNPRAYIRPSPTRGTLGGVGRATHENILLCESAGYDVVLVETVGIGQSEVTVSTMVDLLLLLVTPGGGDDLQGIKKGIMEVADLILVNKADGLLLSTARQTRMDYTHALQLQHPRHDFWHARAALFSSLSSKPKASHAALSKSCSHTEPSSSSGPSPAENPSVSAGDKDSSTRLVWNPKKLWKEVEGFYELLNAPGMDRLAVLRGQQRKQWMWTLLPEEFISRLRSQEVDGAPLQPMLHSVLSALDKDDLTPRLAADAILDGVLVPQLQVGALSSQSGKKDSGS
eukprot:gb/GEZN01005491.1/.p1 GENE.gb/GEZN01005491.1/~~gb/GEZN01005491.1/.p1  ORF type:complete len:492 (-),score=67.48 gb/GEZN01005491.1/:323-1774(-)